MHSKKSVLRTGWYCETCGAFVASSGMDGYPVSRYWRNTDNPQVLVVFCSAACGLKDYEMRNAQVPTYKKKVY